MSLFLNVVVHPSN